LLLVSGVGLAFLAAGATQLIGQFVDVMLGTGIVDDFFTEALLGFAAQVVVGAGLWIPGWTAVLGRRAAGPVEHRATAGRAYLYLVVGVALATGIPSAVFSLYRLINTGLGGAGFALWSDLAVPLAIVVVTSIVAAYHTRLLQFDQSSAGGAAATPEAEPVPAIVLAPSPLVETAKPKTLKLLTLTLRGPADADLEALANGLRDDLPHGVLLDVD
jgi:hypothetical protein